MYPYQGLEWGLCLNLSAKTLTNRACFFMNSSCSMGMRLSPTTRGVETSNHAWACPCGFPYTPVPSRRVRFFSDRLPVCAPFYPRAVVDLCLNPQQHAQGEPQLARLASRSAVDDQRTPRIDP